VHDPFVKLTHLWTDDTGHHSSPVHLLPENVQEFYNGKVYMKGNYSFVVAEKADVIRQLVLEKLAENRQAETLGKT
jgi:hypothetical protein